MASTRDALGESLFNAEWAKGQEETLDEAIEFALSPGSQRGKTDRPSG
jgi:hypothetical protein